MLTTIMLAMQVATAPPVMSPPAQTCARSTNENDIIVCGKVDQEQFRLRPLSSRFERKKEGPGMEFDLGKGAKANVYSTSETSSDGKPDKRIMAKFKIPF